jgi:lysophospholipase L1-like esterase
MFFRGLVHHVLFFLLVSISSSLAGPGFFIQDRDVVLIWGNSITDYGVYPRLIENYVLTHHPGWNVEFFNLGWGGDQAKNVDRLRRDVQLCKPTKATIMLGMNDGGYRPFDQQLLQTYLKGMKDEIELLREHSDPEIMLISPTLYELRCVPHITRGKVERFERMRSLLYPETLRRFSYELGRFAAGEGLRFYDLNYSSTLTAEKLDEYDGNFMYTAESVHPNVDGQLQMGLSILNAMGASSLVAETVIDAASGQVIAQTDSRLTGLKSGPAAVSFTRTAQRLPLPVYPSTGRLIKTVMDYPDAWDRDIIAIKSLEKGWYRLSIDGRDIDLVSAGDLDQGINLSRYAHTPQMIQAYQVFEQTEIRQAAFYTKWRRVLLEGVRSPGDFTPFKTGVNTDSLDRVERAAYEAQHRLNKPVPHSYEISKVAHPADKPTGEIPANTFLDNMIRVLISFDSGTLPEFEPPLAVQGNFSYAPRYGWAIKEAKGYYANIPVAMYDNGTHGDAKAGDGVYSIEMFMRKNSGTLRFVVYDGGFFTGYWNWLHSEYFRNKWCSQLSKAWGEMLGYVDEDGEISGIPLDRDLELRWDRKTFQQALKEGRIYQP